MEDIEVKCLINLKLIIFNNLFKISLSSYYYQNNVFKIEGNEFLVFFFQMNLKIDIRLSFSVLAHKNG